MYLPCVSESFTPLRFSDASALLDGFILQTYSNSEQFIDDIIEHTQSENISVVVAISLLILTNFQYDGNTK